MNKKDTLVVVGLLGGLVAMFIILGSFGLTDMVAVSGGFAH
jgi:hypothetical protein